MLTGANGEFWHKAPRRGLSQFGHRHCSTSVDLSPVLPFNTTLRNVRSESYLPSRNSRWYVRAISDPRHSESPKSLWVAGEQAGCPIVRFPRVVWCEGDCTALHKGPPKCPKPILTMVPTSSCH